MNGNCRFSLFQNIRYISCVSDLLDIKSPTVRHKKKMIRRRINCLKRINNKQPHHNRSSYECNFAHICALSLIWSHLLLSFVSLQTFKTPPTSLRGAHLHKCFLLYHILPLLYFSASHHSDSLYSFLKAPERWVSQAKSEMRNSYCHLIARPNRSCNRFLPFDVWSHWQHYQTDKSKMCFCMEYVWAIPSSAWQEPWLPNICEIATESHIEDRKNAIVPCLAVDEPHCRQSNTEK